MKGKKKKNRSNRGGNRKNRRENTYDTDSKASTDQRDLEEAGGEGQVEGRNPVLEVFRSGRTVDKLLVAQGSRQGSILEIINKAKKEGIVIQEVNRRRLDELSQTGGAHQGVIAFVTPYSYVSLDHILERASAKDEWPFVIVLDQITDPHNLGSIIRTAESCGAHGIVIPKRRAVSLTPAAIKASAGAVEFMPIAKVTNISDALETLKGRGLWVAGADMDGELYTSKDLTGPMALVVGSEGRGLGRLVKEKCDFLVSIPQKGRISSLNASVAAAVIMYEMVRQRDFKLLKGQR
ncbi:MAG: 23S rRNA (guanosine(2251)-2'-O)-methyltransferase RlmB [Clostridiales bacterium]|nr:23S rRNA (guanosine(2251)-2'-O)-methyltransferase RlmB [Clostridiales bacterium]